MTTTDLFRAINAVDGFAADPDDFNNAQSAAVARLFDQVIAGRAPNLATLDLDFPDGNGANIPTGPWAYALHGGAARPVQGSANNKIKITAGTLLQKIANATGLEAQLVAFTFPGTDEVTIANGDATHPRVDLVQMKLEYLDDTSTARDFEDATSRAKSSAALNLYRRVKCTLAVKQGTPAASPTYPAPDAGYVVIAGVVVETNYAGAAGFHLVDTGGGPVAVLHDQRMPLGMRPVHVMPASFINTTFTIGSGGALLSRTGADNAVHVICPTGGGSGRVVGYAALTRDSAGATSKFTWYEMADDGAGGISITATNLNDTNLTAAAGVARRASRWNQIAGHSPAVGSTVLANANGMGAPLWTSGARCPLPNDAFGTPAPFSGLAFSFKTSPGGMGIGPFTFWIADGI